MPISRSPKLQAILAAVVLALGLLLLGYMVTVEGEPGALPLALVFAGGGWLARLGWRARRGPDDKASRRPGPSKV